MKECPWYYEEVERLMLKKKDQKKYAGYSIELLLNEMTAKEKKICFTNFKNDYANFKKQEGSANLLK